MKLKKDKKGRVIIPEKFEDVSPLELRTGDIVLFFGSNKLTKWHGKNRKKKFGRATLVPTHAAIVLGICHGMPIILDPETYTTLSPLSEYLCKENMRIDIVRFKAEDIERDAIGDKILDVASKEGFYDWKGYGAFASQMPYMGWAFKWVKPSKKNFFCSDASAYCVESSTKIKVSPRGNNFTAPVDLLLYGMKHHLMLTLKKSGELL